MKGTFTHTGKGWEITNITRRKCSHCGDDDFPIKYYVWHTGTIFNSIRPNQNQYFVLSLGGLWGVSTFLGIYPEANITFAWLTNVPDVPELQSVALKIVKNFL